MTTTTEKPVLANAVETSDRVASHLHPEGSFEVDQHPVPTGLEEIWRFTPLKRLRGLHKDAALRTGGLAVEVEAPEPVTVTEVAAGDAVVGSSGYVPTDRISARAWQAAERVSVVTVPREAEVADPIVLRHRGEGREEATAGHTVIVAEPHSVATVVLIFTGSATVADVVEVVVGDGARLTVVSLQDWDDDAVHVSHHAAHVGRDASLKHISVTFGGDLVRVNTDVNYAGPGGEAELLGLYFADAGQHLENRLFVDHNQPRTKSNVDYKGALQGDGAHAVWIGDVLIRKVAEGIETYESNKNLLLTDGARADSVPNLEIETGEIAGAGHASTTGRFDDQQLFYLRSRGIPEEEARRLVVHGFFADIVRRIGVPDIEQKLMDAVEAELAQHVGVADEQQVG
ncbi:Fe-S cluster assembly protein SufD [Propionibacteriaceae bacterium Y2011]|uniref:Fe-S cluster assembly protein SufD n=1 Tax=Microlunatus sp. Y2014 TaxID=3418488 RepID=UPI003B4ABCE3